MRLRSMAVKVLGLAALTLILGAPPLWAALTIKGPTKPVNANGSPVTLTVKFADAGGQTETLADAVTSDPDGIISNLKGDRSTVKISKGKGTGKVSFTVSKNASSVTRNATVTVNEVPFTFNQAGQPCKVAINRLKHRSHTLVAREAST